MILLKPSKAIVKLQPDINFATLSLVCSTITPRFDVLKIEMVRKNYSFFPQTHREDSFIYMSHVLKEKKRFIKHFLHEFRHFIQSQVFNIDFKDSKNCIPFNNKGTNRREYLDSPIEVDARNFDKEIGYRALNLYEYLEKKRILFEKLGSFQGTKI